MLMIKVELVVLVAEYGRVSLNSKHQVSLDHYCNKSVVKDVLVNGGLATPTKDTKVQFVAVNHSLSQHTSNEGLTSALSSVKNSIA
jgi:hypothetical protein